MVFGFFSKEAALKRAMKKASSKLAQSPDRWQAMQKLAEHGDDECFLTLFKRFSFQSTKQVEDLEEKDWVVQTLVSKGEAVLPALRQYLLKSGEGVSYPLRILEGFATGAQAREVIDELLAAEPPGYTRDPARKSDAINWLGETRVLTDDEAIDRVIPYLDDYDENVKYAAVSSVALRPRPQAAAALVSRLLNEEEESRRLKLFIGEVLAEHDMDLDGRHKEVSDLLPEVLTDYKLHHNKLVKKVV